MRNGYDTSHQLRCQKNPGGATKTQKEGRRTPPGPSATHTAPSSLLVGAVRTSLSLQALQQCELQPSTTLGLHPAPRDTPPRDTSPGFLGQAEESTNCSTSQHLPDFSTLPEASGECWDALWGRRWDAAEHPSGHSVGTAAGTARGGRCQAGGAPTAPARALPVVSCLVTKDSEGATAAGRGNLLAMQIRHDWKSAKAEEGEGTRNVKVRPHSHRLQLRILIKTALRCSTATSCPGSVHPEQSSSPSKHGGCLETL